MPKSPFSQQDMTRLIPYGNGTLYRCPQTGFLAADPIPNAAELDAYYQSEYFEGSRYESDLDEQNNAYLKNWQRRLSNIEQLVGSSSSEHHKRLLDIGAGTGAFVELAHRHNWEISCVEFSPDGRQAIQNRVPDVQQIESEFSPDRFAGQQYDLVSMWAVIEHLPYDADRLKSFYEITRPGGLVAFSFPNPITINRFLFGANWRYFIPVEHLAFYPPTLFKQMLEQAGFTIEQESSTFSAAACHDGLAKSSFSWLPQIIRKVFVKLTGAANRCLFHGDTYEVIARKNNDSKTDRESAEA
ncbi:MAG: class I SAM-dependent methyltransferase [Planctomycetota bacterium]